MSTSPPSPAPSRPTGPDGPIAAVRMVRIVHGMLISSLALLGAMATMITLRTPTEAPLGQDPGQTPIALAIIAAALSAAMVLPALMFGGGLVRQVLTKEGLSPQERAQRYVGGHVFIAAVIEGPGLLWGILTLMNRDLVLLSGLGFSICALLATGPRASDWEDAGFYLRDDFRGNRVG